MGTRTAWRGERGEGVVRVEMDGKGEMSDKRGGGRICGARAAGEKRSGGRRRGGVHAAGPPPPHDLKKMVPVRASEHKGLKAASAGKTGTGLAPELWRASRRHVRRERRVQGERWRDCCRTRGGRTFGAAPFCPRATGSACQKRAQGGEEKWWKAGGGCAGARCVPTSELHLGLLAPVDRPIRGRRKSALEFGAKATASTPQTTPPGSVTMSLRHLRRSSV